MKLGEGCVDLGLADLNCVFLAEDLIDTVSFLMNTVLFVFMYLVDVHCHLNHSRFSEDLDQVVQRAKEKGVKAIVLSGINQPTNEEVLV